MILRGFLCVLFQPAFTGEAWGSKFPREIWLECLRRSLGTFRKFNPRENLLLVEAHDVLSPAERIALGVQVLPAPKDWPHLNWCKFLALQLSPFDQTCLFDLDFHFCASMGGVFDAVAESVGALAYPEAADPMRRINTGLVVCKDKEWLPEWARWYIPDIGDDDELPLYRAATMGRERVTLLPDIWGRYRVNWEAKGWQADQAATGAKAFHWQGLKPLFASDIAIKEMLG